MVARAIHSRQCELSLLVQLIPTSKVAGLIVTGFEFLGISIRVVTPPAAAAFVPVLNPSHSVRPGSFK